MGQRDINLFQSMVYFSNLFSYMNTFLEWAAFYMWISRARSTFYIGKHMSKSSMYISKCSKMPYNRMLLSNLQNLFIQKIEDDVTLLKHLPLISRRLESQDCFSFFGWIYILMQKCFLIVLYYWHNQKESHLPLCYYSIDIT